MLNDSAIDSIFDIVSSMIDAPSNQIYIWIYKNIKWFENLENLNKEYIEQMIALCFTHQTWSSTSDVYLNHCLELYGWKLKPR